MQQPYNLQSCRPLGPLLPDLDLPLHLPEDGCLVWQLDPGQVPMGLGGKGQTQPSKQLALILPNLVLIAGHLDGPGRCQPGEPVHGDLLKVLEEQHHCLGPTHPGLTGAVELTISLIWLNLNLPPGVTLPHGHLVHPQPLLVLSLLLTVPLFHQEDVLARLLPGSPLTLDVTPKCLRKVKLHHQVTRWNINSFLHHAGGHKDIHCSYSELPQCLLHPVLLLVHLLCLPGVLHVPVGICRVAISNIYNSSQLQLPYQVMESQGGQLPLYEHDASHLLLFTLTKAFVLNNLYKLENFTPRELENLLFL